MDENKCQLTIAELLSEQATRHGESPALLAPGRLPLSYEELWLHVSRAALYIAALKSDPKDRVALVLPNGVDLAVVFLAIASTGPCVPLAENLPDAVYRDAFTDLEIKAVILIDSEGSPIRKIAEELNLQIVDWVLEQKGGAFKESVEDASASAGNPFSKPDDLALLLFTSGTSAQPKRVPLAHAHLLLSAYNHCQTLRLGPEDCCLNIMPLTHIHGLVSALLSSLCAGASICCTSGFEESAFPEWLTTYQATWYTASPTFHQAVLRSVGLPNAQAFESSLRFVRSAAAPLPVPVLESLERTFQVPVIESYGMSEAAAQICSNPLPPGNRVPGSVGPAAGPEVKVLGQDGSHLTAGQLGEVVIRGDTVMAAYDQNPAANEVAFTDGWFRTGDLGYLDASGYLFLKGRLSEIVNRGGKKVSLREVDEALLAHPAVAEAAAFPVTHPTLGQDLAAAVVLTADASITATAIRRDLVERLPDYRVPSQILLLEEISKTSAGKPLRRGLEALLTETPTSSDTIPSDSFSQQLADLWISVLGVPEVGLKDNFIALGGDSLTGLRLLNRLQEQFRVRPTMQWLFMHLTLEEQVSWLASQQTQ